MPYLPFKLLTGSRRGGYLLKDQLRPVVKP